MFKDIEEKSKVLCELLCEKWEIERVWMGEWRVMERLTKKINDCGGYATFNVKDTIGKLGKLEDIEEELGIPLEVLKALKDGIWTKGGYHGACYLDKKPKFVKGDILHIGYYDYYQYDNEELENHFAEDNVLCIFSMDYEEYIYVTRLKDYGVTWSLTREELEND